MKLISTGNTIHKILQLKGGSKVLDTIHESFQETIRDNPHSDIIHGVFLKYTHTFFEVSATIISVIGGLLLLIAAFSAIINTIHLAYLKVSGKTSNLLLGIIVICI